MRGSTIRINFNLFIYIYLFTDVWLPKGVVAQSQNTTATATATAAAVAVNVGVVLDMDSLVGKIGISCIDMALSDFYAAHPHYKTRLVLHTRDSIGDIVAAAAAALDLIRNVGVQAIIGPRSSMQADFVISLGNNSHVPIVSFSATTFALAMAVEKTGTAKLGFDRPNISNNGVSTDLETLGVSRNGPRLVRELSNINFRGLSGDFRFVNGQLDLESSVFQIVNVNGNGERRVGFWTPKAGLVKNLSWQNATANSTSRPKLGPIIWPGDNADSPKVYYGNYDAVVGDVTIVANRINDDFRGPPTYQVGTSFWFSFSTMVFAHREKVVSNAASANGGISAAFDEIPYINLFLSKYCGKYTTIKPTFKTDGFGFVFPKGSPLVSDVSSAILNVTQGDEMEQIQNKWFKSDQSCPDVDPIVSSTRLGLDSFWGLFLLAGIASVAALIMFAAMFLYEQRHVLFQFHPETSLWRKVGIMSRIFDQKDLSSHTFKKTEPTYASSHCSVHDVGVDGSSSNTNCPPSPSSMSNRTDCSDFVFIVAQGSNTSSPDTSPSPETERSSIELADYRQGG
ncbi:hypothetical protein V6N12_056711 [Hibiscus sabdariffa]|uniref:Ionotropic glutamate receptor C-terminal domain-containing protein n=1 Tax=Hibiscus sabdariffa TaxID=183260 RepID=A0ABR2DBX8_9ROSI